MDLLATTLVDLINVRGTLLIEQKFKDEISEFAKN
jgi:hypothetical protein